MTMSKRILVAASMNGGAEVVAPIAQRLKARGTDVRVLSYGAATATFRAMKVEPDRVIEHASPQVCGEEITNFRPNVILTGTQFQDKDNPLTLEQILWQLAKIMSTRSVAILDTWGCYAERFSDLDTALPGFVIKDPLKRLPTKIAIMDEFARQEMLRLGFPDDILAVTGNPYFEYTAERIATLSVETRAQLLAKPVFASFDRDAKLVVFLSDSWKGYPDIGFTETSVLQSFLRVIDNVARTSGIKINIIVRPHPFRNEDAKSAFEGYSPAHAKATLHNPVTARGSDPANEYSLEELFYAADLVVGTFGNPNVTAAVVRTIVKKDEPIIVHWVPGLTAGYTVPPHDFQSFLYGNDVSALATEETKLAETISDALNRRIKQKQFAAAKSGAVERVIELLE